MEQSERLAQIWKQDTIPVVLRRQSKGERPRANLPFALDNLAWLQTCGRVKPAWIEPKIQKIGYWEFPKSWFNKFVDNALIRYGNLYIIQPYRVLQVCSPACQNAMGHLCECSCMGEHHGAGNDGSWFEISDVFSCRWGERDLACRLLKSKTKV